MFLLPDIASSDEEPMRTALFNDAVETNERIYMMAVPFIGGFNPDYSGLDFGEAASMRIVGKLI